MNGNPVIALVFQLVSCAFMTGVIWIIQVLHYPAFADIRADRFLDFHARHSRNITFIVAPMMVLELVTAAWLAWEFRESWFFYLNLALVLAVWASTFLLSVPVHESLSKAQDLQKIQRLVRTNWLRSFLWSLRLALLIIFYVGFFGGSYS